MTETRGRGMRQDEEQQARRRRDDATIDGSQSLKLAVPPDIQQRLTEQGRVWRWANDEGNRIYRLTQLDDWDVVEGVEPRSVVIDRRRGSEITCKAILLSKPKKFVEEDRRKIDEGRRIQERAMLAGEVPNAGNSGPQPTNLYADKANKIERGNQII